MMIEILFGVAVAIIVGLGYWLWTLSNFSAANIQKITNLELEMSKLLSQKKSSEVKLGYLTEKLAPLLAEFPYDLHTSIVIPLGQPIDYIVITDDEIGFVEVKSNDAKHNANQRKIKKLVDAKAVVWKTVKIRGVAPDANPRSGDTATA